MNPQERCKHVDQHVYRSAAECEAIEGLQLGVWLSSLEEFSSLGGDDSEKAASSELIEPIKDLPRYRPVFEYIERLNSLLNQRGEALQIVSDFIYTRPDGETDGLQGQIAAREILFELVRPSLENLQDGSLANPSVVELAESIIDPAECQPIIDDIDRIESRLKVSDRALGAVSAFIGEKYALQKEQLAVTEAAGPRSDKRRRELQGKLDARKELSRRVGPYLINGETA